MRVPTFAIAVVVLLTANPAPLHAQSDEEIILADPAFSLTFAAGYVATDLGLWQKHGIKVKTVAITGIGAINSVISGSSHFAQASASSFGRASARGQKLIAIATTIDRPFAQVVLRKELAEAGGYDAKSPLEKRGALLKGRTIAVDSINSMIHAYVRLVATRSGVNPDDIRIAPMAPASMLAAFQSKQIDGMSNSPPWPLKPVVDGLSVVIASGPDGDPPNAVNFAYNVILAKPETCEKRRQLCVAMGRVVKEAVAYMHSHPQEVIAILGKKFPNLEPKLIAAAFEEIRKSTPQVPIVTKEALDNADDFNVEAGMMKAADKLKSYDGLYTDEFVK